MKKLLNRRIAIVAVAVIATVAFFSFKSGDDRNFQIAKNLDIFNAIVKELDMFYVDTIDPNKTIREGIDNMLYTLDPYTEYYPEEDQSELEQMIKGSFGGIEYIEQEENEQEEAGYSQRISEEEVQADENQRNNHSRNSVINQLLAAHLIDDDKSQNRGQSID